MANGEQKSNREKRKPKSRQAKSANTNCYLRPANDRLRQIEERGQEGLVAPPRSARASGPHTHLTGGRL